jgi:hypothetical protein
MEIGTDYNMVVSHIFSGGTSKTNKFGMKECEVEDMSKYEHWTIEANAIVSRGQDLLYTYVNASIEHPTRAESLVSTRKKILFSRCCKLTYNPENIPGANVILAPDSDVDI